MANLKLPPTPPSPTLSSEIEAGNPALCCVYFSLLHSLDYELLSDSLSIVTSILLLQHVGNTKIINDIFPFCTKSLKSGVYFTFISHLTLD